MPRGLLRAVHLHVHTQVYAHVYAHACTHDYPHACMHVDLHSSVHMHRPVGALLAFWTENVGNTGAGIHPGLI